MTRVAQAPEGGARRSAQRGANATRGRIIAVAMRCFAQEGYAGATTRMMASASGITLPVIAYHFGSKEGLHRACAEAIVDAYRQRMLPLVLSARQAADSGALAPDDARAWIARLLDALIDAIAADPAERLATDFVLREMSEQGPGYQLLVAELWHPGIQLVADLLAIARGGAPGAAADADGRHRTGALMLLAGLSAFTTQAPIAFPLLGWPDLGDDRRAILADAARRMLDGLAG